MSRECNIELEKWDVADNIDLFYILQDFEDYFEMKFLKKPLLVKKAPESVKKGLPLAPRSSHGSTKASSSASKSNTN